MTVALLALAQWGGWYERDQEILLPVTFLRPGVQLKMTVKPIDPTADPYVPFAAYEIIEKDKFAPVSKLKDMEPFVQIRTSDQALEYGAWLVNYLNRRLFQKDQYIAIVSPSHVKEAYRYLPGSPDFPTLPGKEISGYLGFVSEAQWEALGYPQPICSPQKSGGFRIVRALLARRERDQLAVKPMLVEEYIGPNGQHEIRSETPLQTPEEAKIRWSFPTYR